MGRGGVNVALALSLPIILILGCLYVETPVRGGLIPGTVPEEAILESEIHGVKSARGALEVRSSGHNPSAIEIQNQLMGNFWDELKTLHRRPPATNEQSQRLFVTKTIADAREVHFDRFLLTHAAFIPSLLLTDCLFSSSIH